MMKIARKLFLVRSCPGPDWRHAAALSTALVGAWCLCLLVVALVQG